jgi:hypothetical protein
MRFLNRVATKTRFCGHAAAMGLRATANKLQDDQIGVATAQPIVTSVARALR